MDIKFFVVYIEIKVCKPINCNYFPCGRRINISTKLSGFDRILATFRNIRNSKNVNRWSEGERNISQEAIKERSQKEAIL